jgi:hypothetical protein
MARASSSGACAGWHAKTLRAIVMLLGRVIPVEVNDTRDIPVEVAYRSVGEVRRELDSRAAADHAPARGGDRLRRHRDRRRVRIPQAQAVFAGMMIGPVQVAARVMEASVLGRFQRSSPRGWPASPIRSALALSASSAAAPRRPSPCCTAPATASSPSREERCRSRSSGRKTTPIGSVSQRAVPDRSGVGSSRVRTAAGAYGARRRRGFGGPQPFGVDRPAVASRTVAVDGCRGRCRMTASMTNPRVSLRVPR